MIARPHNTERVSHHFRITKPVAAIAEFPSSSKHNGKYDTTYLTAGNGEVIYSSLRDAKAAAMQLTGISGRGYAIFHSPDGYAMQNLIAVKDPKDIDPYHGQTETYRLWKADEFDPSKMRVVDPVKTLKKIVVPGGVISFDQKGVDHFRTTTAGDLKSAVQIITPMEIAESISWRAKRQ